MLVKLAGWFVAVLLLSLALLLAWCEYTENPRAYFASYEDAKNSGIMDRGWITWQAAGLHLSPGDVVMLLAAVLAGGLAWRLSGRDT